MSYISLFRLRAGPESCTQYYLSLAQARQEARRTTILTGLPSRVDWCQLDPSPLAVQDSQDANLIIRVQVRGLLHSGKKLKLIHEELAYRIELRRSGVLAAYNRWPADYSY